MKKKPTKTVKAWGLVQENGVVAELFTTLSAAKTWAMINGLEETVVRCTVTYTPPAKPRKR